MNKIGHKESIKNGNGSEIVSNIIKFQYKYKGDKTPLLLFKE